MTNLTRWLGTWMLGTTTVLIALVVGCLWGFLIFVVADTTGPGWALLLLLATVAGIAGAAIVSYQSSKEKTDD